MELYTGHSFLLLSELNEGRSIQMRYRFCFNDYRVFLFCFAMLVISTSGISAQRIRVPEDHHFVHPGVLHNQAELEFIRNQVQAENDPWFSGWKKLRNHTVAQLDWSPEPRAHVQRGAYNDPDIGASEFMMDGQSAQAHALQWVITGDERYARKGVSILNAWSHTLRTVSNHDAKLLVGMAGINYVNAAELLKHTYDGWSTRDQHAFERMLREVFYPTIESFYPTANGNWDASMIQTMMAMGVFLDDREMFNRAVDYYTYGRGNGAVNHYISEKGIVQESGRDQGHTQMGLGYLSISAEIGWKQGLDLYGVHDKRLAHGYEYTAKYNLGEEVPYEPFTSIEQRYYYPEISSEGRGGFSNIYERVLNHYSNRTDADVPYTRRVVEEIRPEGFSRPHVSWGTLLFADLPSLPAGHDPSAEGNPDNQ